MQQCKQPLDNAEICGGFWGLIASAKEKEAEDPRAGGTTPMLDDNGRLCTDGCPCTEKGRLPQLQKQTVSGLGRA